MDNCAVNLILEAAGMIETKQSRGNGRRLSSDNAKSMHRMQLRSLPYRSATLLKAQVPCDIEDMMDPEDFIIPIEKELNLFVNEDLDDYVDQSCKPLEFNENGVCFNTKYHHNMKERLRRRQLREALVTLHSELPFSHQKPVMGTVLLKAIDEIERLKKIYDTDETYLQELKKNHIILLKQLEEQKKQNLIESVSDVSTMKDGDESLWSVGDLEQNDIMKDKNKTNIQGQHKGKSHCLKFKTEKCSTNVEVNPAPLCHQQPLLPHPAYVQIQVPFMSPSVLTQSFQPPHMLNGMMWSLPQLPTHCHDLYTLATTAVANQPHDHTMEDCSSLGSNVAANDPASSPVTATSGRKRNVQKLSVVRTIGNLEQQATRSLSKNAASFSVENLVRNSVVIT